MNTASKAVFAFLKAFSIATSCNVKPESKIAFATVEIPLFEVEPPTIGLSSKVIEIYSCVSASNS